MSRIETVRLKPSSNWLRVQLPVRRSGMSKAKIVSRSDSQLAFARAATALAVVSVGALAIGALAIGRLAIKHVAIDGATLKRLRIGELEVDRLRVKGRIVGERCPD
jgi:hypothetical protein